jgi:hypothetical protein
VLLETEHKKLQRCSECSRMMDETGSPVADGCKIIELHDGPAFDPQIVLAIQGRGASFGDGDVVLQHRDDRLPPPCAECGELSIGEFDKILVLPLGDV